MFSVYICIPSIWHNTATGWLQYEKGMVPTLKELKINRDDCHLILSVLIGEVETNNPQIIFMLFTYVPYR